MDILNMIVNDSNVGRDLKNIIKGDSMKEKRVPKNNYRMNTQFISGSFKWKDIIFSKHMVCDGVQAVVEFNNGEFCSIVGGSDSLYGNGVTTFEIQSSSTQKTTRGVKGWRTKTQIMRHLNYLQMKEIK